MISSKWLDELNSKVNIEQIVGEYVTLVNKGGRLWACCPFHNEKTPSFTINTDRKFYKCFGCGKGGSVINFVMDMEKLSFVEACQFLADKVGMAPPDVEDPTDYDKYKKKIERLRSLNREAALFYCHSLFSKIGKPGFDYYVKKRGIPIDVIKEFGLGYADGKWDSLLNHLKEKGFSVHEIIEAGLCKKRDEKVYDVFRNRPVMPILDKMSNVIGFGGRALNPNDNPKYLNTAETILFNKRKNLYNLSSVRRIKDLDYIILAEGYMDVIALSCFGFKNAVATLGTALTPEQANLISNYVNVVYISYDGDNAGIKAAQRAVDILSAHGIEPRVILIPDGCDPDEFLRKKGSDAYKELLESAFDRIGFKLYCERVKYDLNTAIGRESYVKAAVNILKKEDSAVIVEKYVRILSKETGFSETAILSDIGLKEKPKIDRPYKPSKTINTTEVIKPEQFVMAMLMERPAAIAVVADEYDISGSDFTNESYGRIFDCSLDLIKRENSFSDSELLTMLTDEKDRFIVTELFETDINELAPGPEKDTYFVDCLKAITNNKLEKLRVQLLAEYHNTDDKERKKVLLKQIDEIIKKAADSKNKGTK